MTKQCWSNPHHKTSPNQLPGHVRVTNVSPPIAVHWNMIKSQQPVDQARLLSGAEKPKEVQKVPNSDRVVRPGGSRLQPLNVRRSECGHIS